MKNKGFTLLELILAMAMSSVIALGIGYLMQTSSENYTSVQRELLLQSDAQMIMDTVSDRLLEANNAYYDSGNHLLTIYHIDPVSGDPYPQDLVWLDTTTKKIYIRSVTGDAGYTDFIGMAASGSALLENYLLGENVEKFESDQVNAAGIQGAPIVTIDLEMMLGRDEYKLNNTIRLRNKIRSY